MDRKGLRHIQAGLPLPIPQSFLRASALPASPGCYATIVQLALVSLSSAAVRTLIRFSLITAKAAGR